MNKRYQTTTGDANALAMPEQASVAMDEIAADLREGLLALAVGAGLQVMAQLMDADVTAVCGPRGKHDPDRTAIRHGTERGSVTLGGRRVPVTRPRVRAADGSGEASVPAYELFNWHCCVERSQARGAADLPVRAMAAGLTAHEPLLSRTGRP